MFEDEKIIDKVGNMIQGVLPEDIEMVDLKLRGKGSKTILKILVDKTRGGISLDDCADINRKISEELDKQDIFDAPYILDVSSPGIDYPLKTVKDFRRNLGRTLNVKIYDGIKENKTFTGKLEEVRDDLIILKDKSGTQISIPVKNVEKAKKKI